MREMDGKLARIVPPVLVKSPVTTAPETAAPRSSRTSIVTLAVHLLALVVAIASWSTEVSAKRTCRSATWERTGSSSIRSRVA